MQRVTDASPLAITVPLQDDTGGAIAATAATWRLFDQDEVEIASGDGALDQTAVSVLIPGAHNAITDVREARNLRVTFATESGDVVVDTFYLVTKSTILAMLENSFQTMGQSIVLRESFGGLLDGWDVATITERTQAMEHAFHKISRLSFKLTPDDPSQYAGYEDTDYLGGMGVAYLVTDIARMPVDKFKALPERFLTALKRAQLLEADNLLGGDIIGKRRADGILSETTGESSMMFNSRPALDLPLSRSENRELSGYIYRRIGLTRG